MFRVLAGLSLAVSGPAVAAGIASTAPAPENQVRFWAEIDYLGWKVKGDPLPALVTTNPVAAPVLGAPGTSVLFGDSGVDNQWRPGARLEVGYWIDADHKAGFEASFFGLQDAQSGFSAASAGSPILGQPFFNALIGLQDSRLIAFPGVAAGSVAVNDTSRLLGASLAYRQEIGQWGPGQFSAVVGYRYLYASDALAMSTNVVAAAGPTTVGSSDSFKSRSDFNGIEIGVVDTAKQGP